MESLYFNATSIRDKNGIAERAARRMKEGTFQCCCNPAWMKNGGLIAWRQMGKHCMKVDLENHSWWNTVRYLRRTSQGSINLVRRIYLEFDLDMLCMRRKLGKETFWSQTLRSWKRWTHRKSTQKKSMQRKLKGSDNVEEMADFPNGSRNFRELLSVS